MKNLTELKVGEGAKVKKLIAKNNIRRRLQDIGLVEGVQVTSLFKSPSGDPTAYQIIGTVIDIRNDDAKMVLVE